jgi:hypothetical protein
VRLAASWPQILKKCLKKFTRRIEEAKICTIWAETFGKNGEILIFFGFLGHFFNI